MSSFRIKFRERVGTKAQLMEALRQLKEQMEKAKENEEKDAKDPKQQIPQHIIQTQHHQP